MENEVNRTNRCCGEAVAAGLTDDLGVSAKTFVGEKGNGAMAIARHMTEKQLIPRCEPMRQPFRITSNGRCRYCGHGMGTATIAGDGNVRRLSPSGEVPMR